MTTEPEMCPRDDTCPSDGDHDTVRGYRKFCRSPAAKAAYSRHSKATRMSTYQGRIVSTVGSQRRIRALGALGWTRQQIADKAGTRPESLRRIMSSKTMNRSTFDMVVRVYDELSMTWGPSELTRKVAATKGWVLPLNWDDHEIDDQDARPRGVGGQRDRVLEGEVRRLAGRGLGTAAIAERLGRHPRVVSKVLSRLRAEKDGEAA